MYAYCIAETVSIPCMVCHLMAPGSYQDNAPFLNLPDEINSRHIRLDR